MCLWPKGKQLIVLCQENKQNHILCPILPFQNLLKLLTSTKFHFYTYANEHKLKLAFFHDSLLMIPVRLNKKKIQR